MSSSNTFDDLGGVRDGLREHEKKRGAADAIGRYDLTRELGSGGMAVVYRARDRELDRTLAVKILRDSATNNTEVRERFLREARSMAGLSHPNVVKVHEIGEDGRRLYLAMEIVDGGTLKERLKRDALDVSVDLIRKAAEGVGAAHRLGIVHRDLKPANILVTREGEPKVVDFGLVHYGGTVTSMTQSGAVMGTPLYMSPEQVRGDRRSITPRTDVYALGIILYEKLAGRPPFRGDSQSAVFDRILNSDPGLPPGPAPLVAICLKAIEKRPADRYRDAEELAADLVRYRKGEPVEARIPSRFRRWVRGIVANRMAAAALAGLVIGGIVVALLFLGGSPESDPGRTGAPEVPGVDRAAVDRKLDEARAAVSGLDRMLATDSWTRENMRTLADKARGLFDDAFQLDPGNAQILLEKARVFAMEYRREEAIREADRAVALNPELETAFLDRAIWRLMDLHWIVRKGRFMDNASEARDLRRRVDEDLARIGGTRTEVEFARGLTLLSEKSFREAGEVLESYAGKAVSDWRGWFWSAVAWSSVKGERLRARSSANKALRFRPLDAYALGIRAWLSYLDLDFASALKDLDLAIRTDPDQSMNRTHRGLIFSLQGKHQEALKDLNRALELDPGAANAHLYRGRVHHHLEEPARALADFGEAIRIAPAWPDSYNARATAFMKLGRYEQALLDIRESIRLHERNPSAHYNRGVCYLKLGNRAAARLSLKKALGYAPSGSEVHARIAKLLKELGEDD